MYLRLKHNLKSQGEIYRSFSNKTSKTHKNPKTGAVYRMDLSPLKPENSTPALN